MPGALAGGATLVLASLSPRRRELLANAGFRFEVRPATVDEAFRPGESPLDYVYRVARAKAEAVTGGPDEIVLAADTVVVVDQHLLGKPESAADAVRMLGLLSGREHLVITGICVRHGGDCTLDSETTRVRFVPLSAAEIEEYVRSGEPMDKAGAYAIQGLASKFIDRIEGCYFNVVGLPVALVYKHLQSRK